VANRQGEAPPGKVKAMNTELLIELILALVRILAAGQFG
jgi:hypothetical protein